MTKDVFLLNTTIHFVSNNGWEYEVRQRHAGPESDKKFYLWTIDDDLLCAVPSFIINDSKLDFNRLYKFVMGACEEYEKTNGRT
jgi:hypothetical protein